jgi:hypothetical protein
MDSLKTLTRPGYLIAALMAILPVADGVMSVWPFRFTNEQWRYGAVGVLSNVMLSALLGILLMLAMAIVLDHRTTRRVLGWICGVTAALLGVTVLFFILDYLQARAYVQAQYTRSVDIASIATIIKQLLTVVALVMLAKIGLAGAKTAKTAAAPTDSTPLISNSNARRKG